ncbi:MAG TPA: heterodisulfide reductase-related iron-sulfur binding cluster [Chloroflexota bacterium]|nr:heterodisulfide reductase-related iron-sulfur binding cluster [Chloroflexota bacterium]
MTPTREIYWNIAYGWLVYPLTLVVVGLIGLGLWRRWQVWRRGEREAFWQPLGPRVKAVVAYAFGQARVVRDPFAGTMHLLLYAGFMTLFIGTLMIAAQEDLRVHFLQGNFYLFYSLILDVFGAIALVGLTGLAFRRYVWRPAHLDSSPEDAITLGLLAAILVTGYVVEGLRIGVTELFVDPALARWSPLGLLTAQLLLALGVPLEAFPALHRLFWWGHALAAFAFLGYWGWSRMSHVLLAPAQAFLRAPRPFGVPVPITDFQNPDRLGVARFAQLSLRQRLSVDTCVHAGRCQASCPAYVSGKPLNPKALILNLQRLARAARGRAAAEAEGAALVEHALSEEGVWACTTCGACNFHCPVLVEPLDIILDLRRRLVMAEGRLAPSAQTALLSIQRRGHPWVGTRFTRTDWAEGLDVPRLAEHPTAEVLFWVGCSGALVERNIRTTQAVARLLRAAGVDFAILGEEETCTGDPARRLGHEFLFQQQARKNIKTFTAYNVKRIVTACPHCFHALKNEYPALGGHYDVVHHTEFLAQLVQAGRLRPTTAVPQTITYHDPCYLGRYNRVYDPPRELLGALPGASRVEMPRCRERGFCCGAGGGHAFLEERGGQRINHLRTAEALATGAEVLASACPFCLQMFEEGLQAVGGAGRVQALDVAELLERALAPAAQASARLPASEPGA